jgi:GT2 family glycosyltransferase
MTGHASTRDQGLTDVAVVVVHHHSTDTVFETVRALVAQGVPAGSVTLVDNSEDDEVLSMLRSRLPSEVRLLSMPNRGYAAAVNTATALVDETTHPYVLVSTHECRPAAGALARLRAALDDRSGEVAVVGPTLINSATGESWSHGGTLSPRLGIPRHRSRSAARGAADPGGLWLDGAFLMMRTALVKTHRLDEDFGIYYEEIEHQRRLQKLGYGVRLVPEAVVEQSSDGIPPYWRTRNSRVFARLHYGTTAGVLAGMYAYGRLIARSVLAREVRPLIEASRGLVASRSNVSVVVVNPLGGALHHYQKQLESVLADAGHRCRILEVAEPSVSGRGRLAYLLTYCWLLLRARLGTSQRLGRAPILVLWPVLHFLDVPFVRVLAGPRARLLMHDPRPLVKTRGSGPGARRFAELTVRRWPVIAQSHVAGEHIREDVTSPGRLDPLVTLPLPICVPSPQPAAETGDPVIRVLGQFKPDRDLAALATIARSCPTSWTLEVRGRGWPAVPGWDVLDAFLSEDEFDNAITTASAIVIPYQRFYQSAVATRAIESGVPVCGPLESSLSELLRSAPELLVTGPDDWTRSVQHAVALRPVDVCTIAASYRDQTVATWSAWLRGFRSGEA